MKLVTQIVLNALKTISRRKLNSVLIFSVLTVSFACSLFMLAMGSAEIIEREKNSVESRILLLKIEETDKDKIIPLFDKVSELCPLNSFSVAGKVTETITEYSNSGAKKYQKTVYIAADMNGTAENFRWTLEMPKKIESGKLFCVSDTVEMFDDPRILNGKSFIQDNVFPTHKYLKTFDNKKITYFLNAEDFFDITADYTDFSITFKQAPDSENIENVLELIVGSISVTDIVLPEKPSGMQVDRTKLFFAVGLLILSFTNIKSAFMFLCTSKKTEYIIYRKYGATKVFLAADIFGMILFFSTISFANSVLLYTAVFPILKRVGADYPINIFTVAILFVAVFVMSCFSSFACMKEVKKYEAR